MIRRAPQEVDPENRGRVLDALHAWTLGVLAGAGLMFWVSLGLGMSLEMLEAPVHKVFDTMSRYLIGVGALGGLGFAIIDVLRSRHYIDVLARAGADEALPNAARYQAARMRKEHPFFAIQIIGGILIGIGAIMAIGALTMMDDASSFFIFAAVGAAGLWGGIALLKAARKAKAWAIEQLKHVRIATSKGYDDDRQQVPHANVGNGLTKWKRALEVVAALPTIASIVGLVIWGSVTGRIAVVGDRITLLPDSFHRDLSESHLAWGHAISVAVVIAAIWVLVLSLPITIIGMIRYERVHRALAELQETSPEPTGYLRSEVSVIALTTQSARRRITFYSAGAGAALISLGFAGVIDGRPAAAIAIIIGAIPLVIPPILDVRGEPAERACRNAVLRAWPNAKLGQN